jgi:NADPH:quinone reductase-like Zn-dependent oxidoreductase
MRQVWISKRGSPDVLQVREADDPMPQVGEIRIRVAFAGVNFADLLARMGLYQDAPKIPCVVGYEVSGVVDAVGTGVEQSWTGTRVVSATHFGGYSDTVCVPVANAMPLPPTVTDEEAAALPVNYLTAHHMLVFLGGIRAKDVVLVHGAAGGVGQAAVQLCHIIGARVVGTASAPKHEFLRTVGVDPIDYRDASWPDRVRDLTNGRGVDIALDAVGGRSFKTSYELLAPAGRLFCYGVSTIVGSERPSLLRAVGGLLSMPRFGPVKLMLENRSVTGVNLGRLLDEPAILQPQFEALIDYAANEQIKPVIDRVYTFDDAPAAHRRLHARQNIGKVLLTPHSS